MTEKLIHHRAPTEPPSAPGGLIAAPKRPEPRAAHWPMLIGPAIGFVLAALLAISFAFALAGGAGEAALGPSHASGTTRVAVFVL